MINLTMNGLEVKAEEGWTILETAKFYGLEIPTLCYNEGLSPYGGCRLCLVEVGEGSKAKLVSSCTYPVEEGSIIIFRVSMTLLVSVRTIKPSSTG